MASRWQQVNELLNEALDLPPEEPEDYLDAHCAEAPDVRREVASLLKAYDGAGSFIETPAVEQVLPRDDDETMTDPLIGKEIDGYQIQGVLGRGGMGVVYEAEDVALSRTVALKMIDPALARDEAFLRRFRAEARALARIDSRHIVGIYALRQAERGLLIVMEYVDGGTLGDRLAEGPMDEPEALALFKQMLRAFDDAHSAGVIHRDIKPGNIMLTRRGTVKVTDFGLARLQQRGTQATVTQGVAGTLNYMSPEQVKGRSDLDHRSDLYALGMVLYEMLAGRLPFDKKQSDFAKMRTIVEEDLPAPDAFRADLPKDLVQIVMKALEKDPAQRYQSAGEMIEAVERVEARAGRKAGAGKTGAQRKAAVPAGGRRGAWIGALGALVIALALGGYFLYAQRAPAEDGNAPPASAALSVTTVPDGAAVYLNGRAAGVAPLEEVAVEGGSLAVLVRKEGYAPVDTTLRTEAGGRLTLALQLAAAQAPEEENTQADEQQTEEDPPPGEQQTAQAEPDGEDEPPPAAPATLTLRIEPSGTVSVGGQSRSGSGAFEVPAGRHTARFSHPQYGAEEVPLTLSAGEDRQLTYYFRHTLNVNTSGAWGSIWIDDQRTGETTPSAFELGPGTYRIEVSIERSNAYRVTGGVYRVEAGGRSETTPISGGAQTVVIEPALQPETHLLMFDVEEGY